jgi:uroporphyrinogen-III synthase
VSGRILLLRSGSAESNDAAPAPDVTVLRTHSVTPRAEGVAEALAFDARRATLVVSSKETIRILASREDWLPLFSAPFAQMLAVGEGTGDLLRKVNAGEGTEELLGKVNTGGRPGGPSGGASTYSGARETQIVVPPIPGAFGVIHFLRNSSSPLPARLLWPRGSDAAVGPLEEIRALGVSVVSPVVYVKRALAPSELDPSVLADFRAGRFSAVAVGSTAGLDALLAAAPRPPHVRWGVLGPETAKAVVARGFPEPLIPAHARLADLLELLRKEIR